MPDLTQQEANDFVDQILSQDERDAINFALASDHPWKHEDFEDPIKANLAAAKVKIKDFHFERVSKKLLLLSAFPRRRNN